MDGVDVIVLLQTTMAFVVMLLAWKSNSSVAAFLSSAVFLVLVLLFAGVMSAKFGLIH